MPELTEGSPAPAFSLPSCDSELVSLADFAGRGLVLYFYPRDNTPGCTQEALDFRDRIAAFEEAGVAVVGVSPDSVRRHCSFRDKHGLNFTLLADPDRQAIEAYGVWVEKKNYGRTAMGVLRSTFLIDGQGIIRKIWRSVRVRRKLKRGGEVLVICHADEVLAAARDLAAGDL